MFKCFANKLELYTDPDIEKTSAKGHDLYYLANVEGITAIPFPVLDSLTLEVLGIGFYEWQKRVDIDLPEEQMMAILKERYRNWTPGSEKTSN